MSIQPNRARSIGHCEPINVARLRLPSQAEIKSAPALSKGSPVQYSDGEVSLVFMKEDYKLKLNGRERNNTNPIPSYATGFSILSGARIAIINTVSGALYGVGRSVTIGVEADSDDVGVAYLGDQPIDIVTGQSCTIPGFAPTQAVTSVHFRLETARAGTGGSLGSCKQIDGPSPFPPLDGVLLAGSRYLGLHEEAVQRLGHASLV